MPVRRSSIAGTWYPGSAAALAAAVDGYLADAESQEGAVMHGGDLLALVAPHAGLVYSGPVAAHAYRLLRNRRFDVAILVGPSHFTAFDGVAVVPDGGFETPLGVVAIDAGCVADLRRATAAVREHGPAHAREHSLEMQLPFLQRLAPATAIVPLLMGEQTAGLAEELGGALAAVVKGRRALLVASTDLSHYHDAATAATLDAVVIRCVSDFDPDGLQRALDRRPDHACGGGPTVAVMRAARDLGGRQARVLRYADSGDVSGDKQSVVGYLAAALGTFTGANEVPLP
ncbi:MAG TPA: AmmeMemoRadiSam system protein B [Vicinamibacterales bacterium]|jgi:AmmeMemoRadiSam system protein B|nr:AmmeMemoRadiSam system protein B [Vicinamibacterales bacterium]